MTCSFRLWMDAMGNRHIVNAAAARTKHAIGSPIEFTKNSHFSETIRHACLPNGRRDVTVRRQSRVPAPVRYKVHSCRLRFG
jgi:hypothetical protein